jgi:predicted transcriptional regulator
MTDDFERPDLFVVVRILEALYGNKGPMRPTSLGRASEMNYDRLNRYLDYFVARELVARKTDGAGGPLYELTPKGYKALVSIANGIHEYFEGKAP